MDEWKPVETPPRDGETVLCFWGWPPRTKYPPACWSVGTYENEKWRYPDNQEDDYADPTHWMPLPAPPKTGA